MDWNDTLLRNGYTMAEIWWSFIKENFCMFVSICSCVMLSISTTRHHVTGVSNIWFWVSKWKDLGLIKTFHENDRIDLKRLLDYQSVCLSSLFRVCWACKKKFFLQTQYNTNKTKLNFQINQPWDAPPSQHLKKLFARHGFLFWKILPEEKEIRINGVKIK